ncbi:MAG: DUF1592 domain-containing protein [Myxococcales bacterium]|nr:MAG: DUF1592 domain-containing protein [Myxococcales bacterium]
MRRVLGRGGYRLMFAGVLLVGACGEQDATTPPPFAGGAFAAAGASSAGTFTTGGSVTTGAQGAFCSAAPLRYPLARYSVADINGSLDLVFGEADPQLADSNDGFGSGYARPLTPQLVTELLAVTRERVQGAAALATCEGASDAVCLTKWLHTYGDQLYRRPLADEQVEAYLVAFIGVEGEAARQEVAVSVLTSMVLSPYFLLRLEVGDASGRISAYDVASRLAHLATRRVPDADLRAKAASDEIFDPTVRLSELRRLWRTPAGRAARELQVLEWLGLSRPAAGAEPRVAEDMARQARNLISQVYDDENGSFSELFTTSRLPLNDRLAEHYGLPLPGTEQLEPVELDQRLFAGLLSTGAFLSRYPRPSQRGAVLLNRLLCVDSLTAPPEAHLEPAPVADTPRLSIQAALRDQPGCVPCHDAFDPTGFALEAFDDQGRLTGFPTSGAFRASLTGISTPVSGPVALGEAVTASPAAQECLERRSLELVTQRSIPTSYLARTIAPPGGGQQSQPVVVRDIPEREWLSCLTASTQSSPELSVTVLMENIAQSELLLTRDDQPRRVTALDTNVDPIEHAYQEALQLQGAYGEEDSLVLQAYAQALLQAQSGPPPENVGGAGGVSAEAGASGETNAAGAAGAGGAAGAP